MFDFAEIYRKPIVVFDTETEGLNGVFTRPWEIGWFVYKNGQELESHKYLLKWPNLKVSPGAAKITNFNPFILERDGRDPKEIIDLFCSYIYNTDNILLGTNILGYDTEIINVARQELGYKPDFSFVKRIFDINAVARGIKWPVRFNKGDDFIAWQYKCLNIKMKGMKTKLEYLCQEYNISFEPEKLHQSSYDSFLTYKVFLELVKKINY